MSAMTKMSTSIHAIVDYEDPYVQPIIIAALKSQLGEACKIHASPDTIPPDTIPPKARLLQIRAYEAIDFEYGMSEPETLMNAYVIRKALIRKHYLSNVVHQWTAKNSESILKQHFMPAEDFELDYAEFLDDALVEAFDLRASFEKNEDLEPADRQWWILKPSMSDRGQGIRLFSLEQELQEIFEEWEAQNPDDDDDDGEFDEENGEVDASEDANERPTTNSYQDEDRNADERGGDHIMTSHLRHFIAQPYIHPPLLIPDAPYNDRKFHIRTYVVAAGALQVYVYSHMLALFASESYSPPWTALPSSSSTNDDEADNETLLQRMRNVHLTNTCVQRSTAAEANDSTDTDADNVFLLSALPLPASTYSSLISQIQLTTAELFRAACASPTNFQALPSAFEVFGVDFLVDESGNVSLLEVNAFPDFAQTGEMLREKVVQGLWRDIVDVVVAPHFGIGKASGIAREGRKGGEEGLVRVLDLDMGRR